MKTWLSLLLLTICTFSAKASDTTTYLVKHYTDENGLPQNSIGAIAGDENGNLWLCTQDGLVRFNGTRFMTFSRHNTQMSSNRFSRFYYAPGNKELYAVNGTGENFLIINGRPVRQSGTDAQRPVSTARDPSALADTMRFYQSNTNYYEITPSDIRYYEQLNLSWSIKLPGNTRPQDFDLLEDQLYLIHHTNGIMRVSQNGLSPVNMEGAKLLPSHSLSLFRNAGHERDLIIYQHHTFYLLSAQNGQLALQQLATNFDAELHSITSAFFSREDHTLFLGSLAEGLFRLSPSLFEKGISPLYNNNIFYSLTELRSGEILSAQGSFFLNGSLTKEIPLTFASISDKYSLITDRNGDVWTKKDRTLYHLNVQSMRIVDSLRFSHPVNCLYLDSQNSLWIGTDAGDIFKTAISQPLKPTRPIANIGTSVTCLSISADSVLWAGSFSGMFQVQLPAKKIISPKELAGLDIRSMYCDTANRIWITTYGNGFVLYEKGIYTVMPMDPNGYLRSSHCFLEDRQGYCWVPTNRGLFQFSKKDLLYYAANPSTPPYYRYYSMNQGLATNEFNGGCQPCAIQTRTGLLAFPSMKGIVFLNPASMLPTPEYAMTVDELMIDGVSMDWNKYVDVPNNMSQLVLRVNVANWSHPSQVRLSFALLREDQSPVWNAVADNRTITLTTLPPGKYRLCIRKQSSFGYNSYSDYFIRIRVSPPWYRHPVALFGWFVLLALLTWLLLRLRVRLVEKQNRLLQETVKNSTLELQEALEELTHSEQALRQQTDLQQKLLAAFSHDVKAPMKHLLFTIESLNRSLLNDGLSDYQQVTQAIHSHVQRVYHLMNNILQYIRAQMKGEKLQMENFPLLPVLQEKLTIYGEMAGERNTILQAEVSASMTVHSNPILFSIILHNLIDNAVKVTVNGAVIITAEKASDHTKLVIQDNGIGMTAQLVDWVNSSPNSPDADKGNGSGLGLLIVKELTALLNIRLQVNSEPGSTVFTLIIPG